MANVKTKLEELARKIPDLGELSADYGWCVDRRGASLLARQRVNHDTRYNIWPNQSEDGRKWTPRKGEKEVLPFKGASDCRPHLIDTYVREDVAQLMVIWRRNRITCTPTESNDIEKSRRLTHLLRWLFYVQMKEAPREARLAANWLLERGQAVLCAWWVKQSQMGYDELDFETLENRAAQAKRYDEAGTRPPGMTAEQLEDAVAAPKLVLDPGREADAVAMFMRYYTDVSASNALRAVRDLRQGYARFPRPYLVINRPSVGARAFHEEVFVPPEATDFDTARSVHERELLSEAVLRERVISHGWDSAWVDKVVEKQRGNVDQRFLAAAHQRWSARTSGITRLQTDKLYEVIHTCRRVADEDGVMAIEYTIWHKDMVVGGRNAKTATTGRFGYHGVLNYDHGQMPYTLLTSERRSRVIDDARGYGEVGATWQALIKGELDQRIDASSLKTVPPYFYPPGGAPSSWGPAVGIETNRPQSYGWIDSPDYNPGSLEIQESVRAMADQYFGRVLKDGSNKAGATAIQQDLADEWMAAWGRVGEQVLQLEQQFGPEEIYYRVIGSDKARGLRATREEIQGQFDVSISFNVQMLDVEYVQAFVQMTDKAMGWDVSGRIDHDEMVQIAFELWDPNLAERVMKPGEAAAASEIEDEANVLSRLSAGIPSDVKPGQAYKMRLDWLNTTVTKSRKLSEQYAQDENFRDLLDEHIKQLTHQIEQQTVNADFGRLGGRPSYMGSSK